MEPEFALRMELSSVGWTFRWALSFNGAGVCTPDGTAPWHPARNPTRCFNGAGVCTPDGTALHVNHGLGPLASMEPEFALRMERKSASSLASPLALQWSRSLHSGWNCSLKIAKENKPCKRLFRAPERRGRIFLSIQHGGRKNSFILADCHCENPPL